MSTHNRAKLIVGDIKKKILKLCTEIPNGKLSEQSKRKVEKWCKKIPGMTLDRFRGWRGAHQTLINSHRPADDDDDDDGGGDDSGDDKDDDDDSGDDKDDGDDSGDDKDDGDDSGDDKDDGDDSGDHTKVSASGGGVSKINNLTDEDQTSIDIRPRKKQKQDMASVPAAPAAAANEKTVEQIHTELRDAKIRGGQLLAEVAALRAAVGSKAQALELARANVTTAMTAKLAVSQARGAELEAERTGLLARSASLDAQIAMLRDFEI